MGGRAAAALGAVVCLLFVVPSVDAEHCSSGISVFGRSALMPALLPPALPRACVTLSTSSSAGHVLPPATDQIFVRVDADIGASYPTLSLRLDGLGFQGHSFPLYRMQGPTGVYTYNLREWLYLPDEDPEGTLVATVRFPGNHDVSARYTLLATPMLATQAPEMGPS